MPIARASLALLIVLLGACASPAPQPRVAEPAAISVPADAESWPRHRTRVQSLAHFTAIGKVAYELPGDAGSASLRWEQAGEATALRLSGPLGVGSTRVTNEDGLLRVRRDGIERLYPADAAPWLPGAELLPIPVGSLHYWLRGVPDPRLALSELELADARAVRFKQAGWTIEASSYRDTRDFSLPMRLTLNAPEQALRLRVILRRWDLPSSS